MRKTLQKDISFSLKVQIVQAKWIRISIYLFTASFVYKNTHATYSHKHEKIMMNNILTGGDPNNEFFNYLHF